MPNKDAQSTQPEIAIGPHAAREGWRVLRVAYPSSYESSLRIGAAIDALLGRPARRTSAAERMPSTSGRGR